MGMTSSNTPDSNNVHNLNKYRQKDGKFGEWPAGESSFDDSFLHDDAPEGFGSSNKANPSEAELAAELTALTKLTHSTALRTARSRSERAGVEYDDLAQDVVMSYFQARRAGKVVENPTAWARRAVFTHLGKAGQHHRAETRNALVARREFIADFQNVNGRRPSPAELEGWGSAYREAQPPRRRPEPKFWLLPERPMENGYANTDTLMKFAEFNAAPEAEEQPEPDSWTEIALTLQGMRKVHAKKFLAPMLCENADVPVPSFAGASQTEVRRWRTLLNEHPGGLSGAIDEAVETHMRGDDSKVTEAVFGPWGRFDTVTEFTKDGKPREKRVWVAPDPGDLDGVAELFQRNSGEVREAIYQSAAAFTDRTNRQTILDCAVEAAQPDIRDKAAS